MSQRRHKTSRQSEMMAKEGYLRPIVVAERTGYHKSTIYRWIKDHRVEVVPFSSSYYIRWSSVVKLLGPIAPILGLDSDDAGSDAAVYSE